MTKENISLYCILHSNKHRDYIAYGKAANLSHVIDIYIFCTHTHFSTYTLYCTNIYTKCVLMLKLFLRKKMYINIKKVHKI